MHEQEEVCIKASGGKPEGKNHQEDQDVDGRTILKWILEKQDGGMDWIHMA
jgi:hypothetical protein